MKTYRNYRIEYRNYLEELKKHFCELYKDDCHEIEKFEKEIWKDREEKRNYNDSFHTYLMLSTAIGVLNKLKELRKRKYIENYDIHLEAKIGVINPDILTSLVNRGEYSVIIIEVENSHIPMNCILYPNKELLYVGRILEKTLRYSPYSNRFYLSYYSHVHLDFRIMRNSMSLISEKNAVRIRNILEEYYRVVHGKKTKRGLRKLLYDIDDSHIEGFILTNEGRLEYPSGLIDKRLEDLED